MKEVRVCEAMKSPVGTLSDGTVLHQQDGGAKSRQVPICEKRIYKVSVSITHQQCDFHPQRMRKGRFHICSLWQPLK